MISTVHDSKTLAIFLAISIFLVPVYLAQEVIRMSRDKFQTLTGLHVDSHFATFKNKAKWFCLQMISAEFLVKFDQTILQLNAFKTLMTALCENLPQYFIKTRTVMLSG